MWQRSPIGSLVLACGLFIAPISGSQAAPGVYPQRAVRIVVPSAPGGGYDFLARVMAEKLPGELGQAVVVENRPGSGTLLGTQIVAAAAADGYPLLVGGLANLAFNPGLYAKPGYDPITDFVSIGLVGSFSYTLVARKDLPQSTIQEVISAARAQPGKLTMANAGIGSGQQVAAALFEHYAGIELLNVQYKGAQPAYTDLLAGRVDLFFDNTTTTKPFIEAQRIKALMSSGANRDPLLPSIPNGVEAGMNGLVLESWIGLFAPAHTPDPVIATLRQALGRALTDPAVRARFETNGWRLLSLTPEDTSRYVRTEAERWTRFLREAGIRGE